MALLIYCAFSFLISRWNNPILQLVGQFAEFTQIFFAGGTAGTILPATSAKTSSVTPVSELDT